jgi:predicted HicB family RNase H-like nuclease
MGKETQIVLTQSQEKYREVLQVAENLYRQDPDWVTFFREVVGIDGAIRKCFPSFEELSEFEQSEEFEKVQKMLVKLREKRAAADPETEPTRVITVRLPKSMHEYLRTEAHDLRTSMNKLCISKLLQVIGEEMIPNERSGSTSTPAPTRQTPINSLTPTPVATTPITTPTTPTFTQSQPLAPKPITPQAQPAPSPFKPTQPRF